MTKKIIPLLIPFYKEFIIKTNTKYVTIELEIEELETDMKKEDNLKLIVSECKFLKVLDRFFQEELICEGYSSSMDQEDLVLCKDIDDCYYKKCYLMILENHQLQEKIDRLKKQIKKLKGNNNVRR